MPQVKQNSRRPIMRKKFGGITVTVQRSKKAGYEALAILRRDGKVLEQRYCQTEAQGKAQAEKWVIESGNVGVKAAASITEREKRMLMDARENLEVYGKTVADAVTFYLAHLKSSNATKPVGEVVDELLLHRRKKGRSSRYQDDMRLRLSKFSQHFDGTDIAEISRENVEEWLDSLEVAPVTYNNFRRLLHVLWSFAVDKQWVGENVVSRIEPLTVKLEAPGILTVEEAAALLKQADPAIIPYLVIALFGGLRDAELKRLEWKAVDLQTGYIKISASVSKTARERLVPITPNMRAWLNSVPKQSGAVTPKNLRLLLQRAKKASKITPWPHDATRHSFGTYEMARTKNIGHVSEVMGNSPSIVQRHYKAAVAFELGEKFFSLMPPRKKRSEGQKDRETL
jgi:integrase